MSAGGIVWQDLITGDPRTAHTFNASIFNWSIEESDIPDYGTIRMIYANETAIATIEASTATSDTPYWLPYILVPDSVESACERALAAGATIVHDLIEHAEFGRYAVLSDPNGARFAPFEHIPESGFTPVSPEWTPRPGSISWYAVSGVSSVETAGFYAAVFGYDASQGTGDGLPDDHIVLQTGGQMHAGVLGHGGAMASQWLLYFAVEDINAIPRRSVELGGQVVTPIINIPEIGRIVGITDPTGATFFAHQPE